MESFTPEINCFNQFENIPTQEKLDEVKKDEEFEIMDSLAEDMTKKIYENGVIL